MMNVLQIQDDLKNFSEDQLIREMQQPSGSAPQFLILSELNRRKRVKGEFAARQAQNAPTVAEEVVAAAGVPQSGMMGMSEAMAPASVESGGIGSMMPKTMKMGGEIDSYADGGVIKAQDGLPKETSYADSILEYIKGMPSAMYETGNAALDFLSPRIKGVEPKPDDTGFESMLKGAGRNINLLADIPSGIYSGAKAITDPVGDFFTKPGNIEEAEKKELEDAKSIDKAVNEATSKVSMGTKTEKQDETKPLTLQEELIKRQAGLEKDRDFDRYMALAQAGLGILASEKPTLAGAVGEGGMKGLEAFKDANKRYEEGITDILNARVKLASKNTGLSQKDAISAIGVIDRTISNLRKEAEKSFDETALAKIERDIAQLRFQKRALMPRAGFGYLDIDVSDSTASKG